MPVRVANPDAYVYKRRMRIWLFLAALCGATGVMLAAFGQHALAGRLEPKMLSAFDIAGRFQLVHAVAMAVAALVPRGAARGWAKISAALFFAGILLFCGSLYLVALSGIRIIGIVTPVGGIALMFGWLALAMAAWKITPGD